MEGSNKKRKIEQTENQYEAVYMDGSPNFLSHTALSYRENKEEELGSYVTDEMGMFLHKTKLMQAFINEDMEVEFRFVRELDENELKLIEHRGDIFPKSIINVV